MVTRRIGSVLLLRQGTDNPSDVEWEECITLLRAGLREHSRMKVLVRTDGGGPTIPQRRKLQEAAAGSQIFVAVVSESVRVRFIVSSVALVTTWIQSYRVREMSDAYQHLQLTASEQNAVDRNLAEMDKLIAG